MQTTLPPLGPQFSYLPPPDAGRLIGNKSLHRSMRVPAVLGVLTIMLLIGGFGFWAATAPLAGGAVASGVISPEGSRKTIQHLEGGIIGDILVRDGDVVQHGTPLIQLEDTQARALYDMQMSQYQAHQAAHARLTAEQLGRDSIQFSPELLSAAAANPEVRDILEIQRQLFVTRGTALASRKHVLRQRIQQFRQQIRGFEAQVTSTGHRLGIVKEELVGKEMLFAKGYVPKPLVLALRREQAAIAGDRGQYQAAIARALQQIGETELEIVSLDAERSDENAREIDRVRGEMAKLKEQLRSSEDQLQRTVITAPVAGTVVNLRFRTRGGVVQPGTPILDIVPAEDDLLIEARVAPVDIDVVHPGLLAQVHLLAYKQRAMPRIDGKVREVSADSLHDETTGAPYYLARVEVDREQLDRLDKDIELVAGMPAEVLIVTAERTLLDYFLEPFRDLFRRSLREV